MNANESASKARLAMHGRILRCPVGDNPTTCPLHTVRHLSIEERIAWLESKTDDELIAFYEQHIDCMDVKL